MLPAWEFPHAGGAPSPGVKGGGYCASGVCQ